MCVYTVYVFIYMFLYKHGLICLYVYFVFLIKHDFSAIFLPSNFFQVFTIQRKIYFIILVYFISLQSNSDFFSINITKVLIKAMDSLFKAEKGVRGIFAQMEKTHTAELMNGLLRHTKTFLSLVMLGYMSSNTQLYT